MKTKNALSKGDFQMFRIMSLLFMLLLPMASPALSGEDAGNAEVRGYLGASLDYEESEDLGRYRVSRITPDGPAESSQLRVGDLIIAVNGVSFRFTTDLQRYEAFLWLRPKDIVTFDVLRENGTQGTVEVIAGSMNPETQYRWDEVIRNERQSEVVKRLKILGKGKGTSIRVERTTVEQLKFSAPGHPEIAFEHVEAYLRSMWVFEEAFNNLEDGDRFAIRVANRSANLDLEIEDAPDYLAELLEKGVSRHSGRE